MTDPTFAPPLIDLTKQQTAAVSTSSTVSLPSGSVLAFAGSTAPAGYVLCDGSTYDGTTNTYANLWTALGTTYGGSGQSAFKVPDMQGRVAVCKGTNADVSALGSNDGVAVANRRPKHRHTPHTHIQNPHTHTGGGSGGAIDSFSDIPNSVGNHSVTSTTATNQTADGGSGTATDSLDAPAYLVLNYIIAL